ncbi:MULTISPECIES: tyrosine-type recombinase/integrase [Bacillus subtilis group]|uniref:tyrosine-type recombinase/integrase n=1 Tax=Bacillus subtilis group TaxID=653685 RepID=UPI002DBDD7D3|nr:tyrosine-type recombinase/integrase [Bacillus mojavensis]MEC1670602.1 tyrosine-type recombinase/integrase [Bacillus mojavensis]
MDNIRKGKPIKRTRRRKLRDLGDLDGLFQTFITIKTAEGKAKGTLQQYRDNYKSFTTFLDEFDIPRSPTVIDRDTIRHYINYMRNDWVQFKGNVYISDEEKKRGLSDSTINTRLKTLRVMYNTLENEGLIDNNIMDGVKNVKEIEEPIIILQPDELQRLLKAPDKKNFADFRDYVLMNVLLDGMMRIGEITHVEKRDFDFKSHILTIRSSIAKNRKTRYIPLLPTTCRLVQELIAENELDFKSDYVFLTNYGARLDRNHFRKRLVDFAAKANVKKKVHPHLFRHTAATMFLENGGDSRMLQKLLGHLDLRMIQRYTHVADKSVAKAHAKHTVMNYIIKAQAMPRKIKRF